MLIRTQATPNPNTLKFLPECDVIGDTPPLDFPNADAAAASPLAQAIFAIADIDSVFLGADFIAVTKSAGDWQDLKPQVLAQLMDFFISGQPVLYDRPTAEHPAGDDNISDAGIGDASIRDAGDDAESQAIVAQIKELLETRVRPMVARDGGDIVFHSYRDGVVWLHMRGACAGCPQATATLKMGIENLLKHFIADIAEVRSVDETADIR